MIVLSYAPVIEELLVKELGEYLFKDINWKDLFPNYPVVRISNEYPWVPYMTNTDLFTQYGLDLNKINETLFPSITIVTNQDAKSPTVFVSTNPTELLKTEDFRTAWAADGYMIAPEALDAIDTHFLTKDTLYGAQFHYQNRDTIAIDITTDDPTNIKNRLYDLCELYLKGTKGAALRSNGIEIIESGISGNRSGTYNIEFGRVLRGASIQVEVDYTILQVYYDPDAEAIADIIIDHTVGG